MNGMTAGIFSVAGMIVVLALFATAVKNGSGTSQIIQNTASGFGNVLMAASGSTNSTLPYAS